MGAPGSEAKMGQAETAGGLHNLTIGLANAESELRQIRQGAEKMWRYFNAGEGTPTDLGALTSALSSFIVTLGSLQVQATNLSSTAAVDSMGAGS